MVIRQVVLRAAQARQRCAKSDAGYGETVPKLKASRYRVGTETLITCGATP